MGPSDVVEYRGPASPDLVNQSFIHPTFDFGSFDFTSKWDAISAVGGATTTDDWNAGPLAPGAWVFPHEVVQAQPGKYASPNILDLCTFCRQGNTFYPTVYLQSGDPDLSDGPYGFDPNGNAIHLYRDGQEIPPGAIGGVAAYQLPAERARYELVTVAGGASTTWHFTSQAPTSDHIGEGYACLGTLLGGDAPCEPDSLVLLRYNANTSLSNMVTASDAHMLQVTGYHQAPDAPAISSMKVWTSIDGGATWQKAIVTGGEGGTYTAVYTVPDISKTNGEVSIKAQASDADGNDITETILNAVKLAPRTSGAQ
jgi:hypothetical protein